MDCGGVILQLSAGFLRTKGFSMYERTLGFHVVLYRIFAQFFYKREPERAGAAEFLETQVCH